MSRKNSVALFIIILLIAIAIGDALFKQSALTKDVSSEHLDVQDNLAKTQPNNVVAIEKEQSIYMAPNFELETIDGKPISLADYAGKKVLLNFWATWCPPCNAEAPHLQTIYEQYGAAGIEIIAVNVTSQEKGKGKDTVPQFVQQYGLTFPVVLDVHDQVVSMYQILTLPTTYFIDEEGAIIEIISGPMDEQLMHEILYQMDNT